MRIKSKLKEYWNYKQEWEEANFLRKFSFSNFDEKISDAKKDIKWLYHKRIYMKNLGKIILIQATMKMHLVYKKYNPIIKTALRINKLFAVL